MGARDTGGGSPVLAAVSAHRPGAARLRTGAVAFVRGWTKRGEVLRGLRTSDQRPPRKSDATEWQWWAAGGTPMATVLITGSDTGIGLELARQLAQRGDDVVATCIASSAALSALPVRVIEGVDVTSDAAVHQLGVTLAGLPLDMLINNAGVFAQETLDTLDFDGMRRHYEVNALGPLRVTAALRPNLRRGAKVAIVSSRVGSIGDNASGANYGYRASKAAVNMIGVNLAHDLRPAGVAVALLHPGAVATAMNGGVGVPVAEAAEGLLARIDALTLAESGGFWHANGMRLPW